MAPGAKKPRGGGKGKGRSGKGALAKSVNVPVEVLSALARAGMDLSEDVSHRVRTSWPELQKAGRIYPGNRQGAVLDDGISGPKSYYHDPFSLMHAMGWKERVTNVTFQAIDDICAQLGAFNTIHNYKISVLQRFLRRFTSNAQGIGFALVPKRGAGTKRFTPTRAEEQRAAELENFILNCGEPEPNPYSRQPRDKIRGFIAKWYRDQKRYDGGAIELVSIGVPPFKAKGVYEFYAQDACTFRVALDQRPWEPFARPMDPAYAQTPWFAPVFDGQRYSPVSKRTGKPTRYVQVMHGMIVQEFSEDELLYTVQYPRTNVRVNGYGYSTAEQVIMHVTSLLYSDQYHRNFYKGLQRGLLALKGRWGKGQIAKFRRHFAALAAGIVNSHRIPFLELDPTGDVKFIDWHKSEQDTGSLDFMKFMYQLIAAVELVEPEEIGWHFGSGVASRPMFEEQGDWKARAGRQRWLPSELLFVAETMQRIVDLKDDHYEFEWRGLDEPSREQLHQERLEKVATYQGFNEARESDGMEPISADDMLSGKVIPPLSPTLVQYLNMLQQHRMMAAQGVDGEGGGRATGEGGEERAVPAKARAAEEA